MLFLKDKEINEYVVDKNIKCVVFDDEDTEAVEMEALTLILEGGEELEKVLLNTLNKLNTKMSVCDLIRHLPKKQDIYFDSDLFNKKYYGGETETLWASSGLKKTADSEYRKYLFLCKVVRVALEEIESIKDSRRRRKESD